MRNRNNANGGDPLKATLRQGEEVRNRSTPSTRVKRAFIAATLLLSGTIMTRGNKDFFVTSNHGLALNPHDQQRLNSLVARSAVGQMTTNPTPYSPYHKHEIASQNEGFFNAAKIRKDRNELKKKVLPKRQTYEYQEALVKVKDFVSKPYLTRTAQEGYDFTLSLHDLLKDNQANKKDLISELQKIKDPNGNGILARLVFVSSNDSEARHVYGRQKPSYEETELMQEISYTIEALAKAGYSLLSERNKDGMTPVAEAALAMEHGNIFFKDLKKNYPEEFRELCLVSVKGEGRIPLDFLLHRSHSSGYVESLNILFGVMADDDIRRLNFSTLKPIPGECDEKIVDRVFSLIDLKDFCKNLSEVPDTVYRRGADFNLIPLLNIPFSEFSKPFAKYPENATIPAIDKLFLTMAVFNEENERKVSFGSSKKSVLSFLIDSSKSSNLARLYVHNLLDQLPTLDEDIARRIVNHRSSHGSTPIDYAFIKGKPVDNEILEKLLDLGADVTKENDRRLLPIDYALAHQPFSTSVDILKRLITSKSLPRGDSLEKFYENNQNKPELIRQVEDLVAEATKQHNLEKEAKAEGKRKDHHSARGDKKSSDENRQHNSYHTKPETHHGHQSDNGHPHKPKAQHRDPESSPNALSAEPVSVYRNSDKSRGGN